jgi:hypothetical protein
MKVGVQISGLDSIDYMAVYDNYKVHGSRNERRIQSIIIVRDIHCNTPKMCE